MLCVLLITFPPSKDFETYLQAFIQTHTSHQEGRVDVMAKHCLRRLSSISKKGPRGKPPSVAEIETASVQFTNLFGVGLPMFIVILRMLHSTRRRLVNPWMRSLGYKKGIIHIRKFPSYSPSLRMAFSLLVARGRRASSAYRAITILSRL